MTGLGPIQWIALILAVLAILLFMSDVRKWSAITQIVNRRQRYYRIAIFVFVEIVLFMIFIAPIVIQNKGPIIALVYWTICTLFALAVLVLALLDLKCVSAGYANYKQQAYEDLKKELDEDK